jgi:RND family efflux transporter MFP subunit
MPLEPKALETLRIDRGGGTERYEEETRKRWPYYVAAVVFVLMGVTFFVFRPKAPVVTTMRVEASSSNSAGSAVLNASGYVVARRVATISAQVTGRLTEVLIEEGAAVKEGQVLARLDPVQANARTGLARRQLDAAERNLSEIEVRMDEAKRNLGRVTALRERQLVSETDLDTAKAEYNALVARLAATRAQQQVAASTLNVQLRDNDQLEVRAPFAGVVISKDAQPGEIVSPISAGGGFTRTGIATIVDMESREIEVDVNESFINRVHDGQSVEATLDAYPDWNIPAHVISIVPTADRQKATVRVRIAFNELDPRILPNMGVKTRFLDDAAEASKAAAAESKAPKLRIAADALVRDGDRTYVWIVRGQAVEKRAVSIGSERDGTVEVHAGVNVGDVIVSPAIAGLHDGAKVKVKDKGVAS